MLWELTGIQDIDNRASESPHNPRPPKKKGRTDENMAQGRMSIEGKQKLKSRQYQFSHGPDLDENMLSKLHAAKDAGRVGSKMCLEGTRVALLQHLHDWVQNPSGERALLLEGAAGKGKSAIAHTIAKQLEDSAYPDLDEVPCSEQLQLSKLSEEFE
ncbi:hypothetical protein H0H92_000365, partial [Tricholoma furcatifolium]